MEYIIDFEIKNLDNNILNKIVKDVRSELGDIKNSGLINKCDYVTKLVSSKLDNLGIDYNVFETHKILGSDVLGHMFLVVYIDDNSYIVDLSYLQFFFKDRCSESMFREKDGITYMAPDPGYYYIKNSDKEDVAKEILEKGYVSLNERNIKIYLDSFFETRRGRRIDYDISSSVYMNVIEKVRKSNVK